MSIFNYKNKDIYYRLEGNDKSESVIVILNGIMMNVHSWDIFMDKFGKDHKVLRFDMFDQGLSSKMDEDYTQDIQVELLKKLLEHLNISKVNLVGISYGGSIALQFVVKYPLYVNKMIVANAVSMTKPWLKSIGDGWNEVAKSRNGLAYYNITIPYIYSPEFYNTQIEWMEDRKKILVPLFSDPIFLDSMIRLTNSASTHNVESSLKEISCRTLIISSEMDYLTPAYEQTHLNEMILNSHLVLFENTGHASMYEKQNEFTELVLEFLKNS